MEGPAGALGSAGSGVVPAAASHRRRAPTPREQGLAARRPRVAFQAYALHLAQFYRPVVQRLLREDLDLHFVILFHPEQALGAVRKLERYAREQLGMPAANVHRYWQDLAQRYDLLICNDVFARFPLRRCPRWLMWHGAGTPHRFVSRSPWRKTVFDFDLLLTGGPHDAALVRAIAAREGIDLSTVAAGVPFLDRLEKTESSRDDYLARLSLDPRRKTILFAPHWGAGPAARALPGRSFEQCLDVLAASGLNVVVKPHAWSRRAGRAPGWERTLRRYPTVAIDRSRDDVPALRHADILVTDASSRAFNFMLLDRPVILVSPPDFSEAVDRDRAGLMASAALVADGPADLAQRVRQAESDPGHLRAERRRAAAELFANHGQATEVVAGLILEQAHAA